MPYTQKSSAPEQWVDFKQVRAAVTMQMVIDHYQLKNLRSEKGDLVGRCPIHRGEGSRAFHISLTKNAFHCFSCKAKGNVIDFVAAMEQVSVREAAVKLASWFSVSSTEPDDREEPHKTPEVANRTPNEEASSGGLAEEGETENLPLKFVLKDIDSRHPYLASRGISLELAAHFSVGFFSGKGSMAGRIVIPIHNSRGELVAYGGRTITESDEPRYKFPNGFQKSRELYNLHRVLAQEARTVIVVEGFFSCMQIAAAGFPCVALMGSSLSDRQRELLTMYFSGVLILLDGDAAGRSGTDECLVKLGRSRWVKSVMLPDGVQPDHLPRQQLAALFT